MEAILQSFCNPSRVQQDTRNLSKYWVTTSIPEKAIPHYISTLNIIKLTGLPGQVVRNRDPLCDYWEWDHKSNTCRNKSNGERKLAERHAQWKKWLHLRLNKVSSTSTTSTITNSRIWRCNSSISNWIPWRNPADPEKQKRPQEPILPEYTSDVEATKPRTLHRKPFYNVTKRPRNQWVTLQEACQRPFDEELMPTNRRNVLQAVIVWCIATAILASIIIIILLILPGLTTATATCPRHAGCQASAASPSPAVWPWPPACISPRAPRASPSAGPAPRPPRHLTATTLPWTGSCTNTYFG